MIEGSGSGAGSIPLTNRSGSRRPTNMWIRWIRIRIRIRNTGRKANKKGQTVTKRGQRQKTNKNRRKNDRTSMNGTKWLWKMKRIIFAELLWRIFFTRKKATRSAKRSLGWGSNENGWRLRLPAGQPSQTFRHHKPSQAFRHRKPSQAFRHRKPSQAFRHNNPSLS